MHAVICRLNFHHALHELPCGERYTAGQPRSRIKSKYLPSHWNDLEVSNTQSHEESSPAFWPINGIYSIPPAHSTRGGNSSNLHPPPDHLERIRCGLTDCSSYSSTAKITNSLAFFQVREPCPDISFQSAVCEKRYSGVWYHSDN